MEMSVIFKKRVLERVVKNSLETPKNRPINWKKGCFFDCSSAPAEISQAELFVQHLLGLR